jgi:hypothetical protein
LAPSIYRAFAPKAEMSEKRRYGPQKKNSIYGVNKIEILFIKRMRDRN